MLRLYNQQNENQTKLINMKNKKFASVLFLSILFTLSQLVMAQPNKEMDLVLSPFVPKHATAKPAKPRIVLVFNCLNSYYHADAILWASHAIALSGEKTGAYQTIESSDPAIFTKEKLAQFDAIILNNSQGNVFGEGNQADARKQAIIDFVNNGKGLIALHATAAFDNSNPATKTENAFRQMIGGALLEHPWNYDEFSPITIRVEGTKHPLNTAFGKHQDWLLPFRDEIFQFSHSFSRDQVRVLLSLNMELTPDKGSNPQKDYPLAWIKNKGKGRVFYSALGHSGDTYQDPKMLTFLLAGIQFAIGDLKADVTPVKQSKFDPEKGYVSIFNGKDLNGWRGESRIWSVEDNCITGQTTEKVTVDKNNYLIWKGGELKDFELKAKFKLIGGNSGFYFHSYERTPTAENSESLVGVQADFSADHVWVGTIMEYKLREKLAERGRKVVIKEDGTRVDAGSTGNPDELLKIYKDNDWNDYHVIVRDNLIVLRINDVVMSEIRDYDKERLVSGLLALQVHVGPPMKVQFKDIRIKKY
jgi:type 1 glutamine amidotransferase